MIRTSVDGYWCVIRSKSLCEVEVGAVSDSKNRKACLDTSNEWLLTCALSDFRVILEQQT